MATEALRYILINLQGTLLKHLWSAQEDENVTDFQILVDASGFGRIQSVTVLNELYMRMAQAAPLNKPTTDSGRVYPSPKIDPDRSPNSTRKRWGLFTSRAPQRESELAPESLIFGNIYEPALNDPPLGLRLGGKVSSTEISSSQTGLVPSISSGDLADAVVASSRWKISAEMTLDEENPWREETSISSGSIKKAASPETTPAVRTSAHMPRGHSTEVTLIEHPPRLPWEPTPMRRIAPCKPRKQLISEPPSVAERETPSESKGAQKKFPFMPRRRTTPGVSQNATPAQTHNLTPVNSSEISRTQTKQSALLSSNKLHGGYCKGAHKLQVGLYKKSVKLRSQSTSMTGQSNYWACASSKCSFEGPACKNGNNWVFDDTVRVFNTVQFRWTFLAKCHVALSKVKNRQYD